MKKLKIAILGLGLRGERYCDIAHNYMNDRYEVVAIIDNSPRRQELARRRYGEVKLYTDYKDFLKDKVEADLVAVCTQDKDHIEHATAMMENGYDLLLEKPMCNNEEDCLKLYEVSKKYNRKVVVCHVLRFTPFYRTVKQLIDDNVLGDIVNINASENVGFYHYAHSFARGPWRNKEESSPMILAKSCHDMDMMRYLMGKRCLSVSSFGDLSYFNKNNLPEVHAKYCTDCKNTECIYNAVKLYTSEQSRSFARYYTIEELTDENILKALPHTQYDKCIFDNDNNVVDHQIVNMLFEGNRTVSFTMCAFSKEMYRDIKILGTKAELYGVMEDKFIEVRPFGGEKYQVPVDLSGVKTGGHGGGDYYLMENLYKAMVGEPCTGISFLDVSIESHLMAFAAEKSRLNEGKPEKIKF